MTFCDNSSHLISFILDLQQRVATSQSRTGTAEYVTPGSLDTNINVGGPSDQGESGIHRTWSIADMEIPEAPPHMPSPGGDVSVSLPPDDYLLDSRSSTNSGSKGLDPIASALVNPLSAGQSKFMASAQGRECKSALILPTPKLTWQSTSALRQTGHLPVASSVSPTNTSTKAQSPPIIYSSMV